MPGSETTPVTQPPIEQRVLLLPPEKFPESLVWRRQRMAELVNGGKPKSTDELPTLQHEISVLVTRAKQLQDDATNPNVYVVRGRLDALRKQYNEATPAQHVLKKGHEIRIALLQKHLDALETHKEEKQPDFVINDADLQEPAHKPVIRLGEPELFKEAPTPGENITITQADIDAARAKAHPDIVFDLTVPDYMRDFDPNLPQGERLTELEGMLPLGAATTEQRAAWLMGHNKTVAQATFIQHERELLHLVGKDGWDKPGWETKWLTNNDMIAIAERYNLPMAFMIRNAHAFVLTKPPEKTGYTYTISYYDPFKDGEQTLIISPTTPFNANDSIFVTAPATPNGIRPQQGDLDGVTRALEATHYDLSLPTLPADKAWLAHAKTGLTQQEGYNCTLWSIFHAAIAESMRPGDNPFKTSGYTRFTEDTGLHLITYEDINPPPVITFGDEIAAGGNKPQAGESEKKQPFTSVIKAGGKAPEPSEGSTVGDEIAPRQRRFTKKKSTKPDGGSEENRTIRFPNQEPPPEMGLGDEEPLPDTTPEVTLPETQPVELPDSEVIPATETTTILFEQLDNNKGKLKISPKDGPNYVPGFVKQLEPILDIPPGETKVTASHEGNSWIIEGKTADKRQRITLVLSPNPADSDNFTSSLKLEGFGMRKLLETTETPEKIVERLNMNLFHAKVSGMAVQPDGTIVFKGKKK